MSIYLTFPGTNLSNDLCLKALTFDTQKQNNAAYDEAMQKWRDSKPKNPDGLTTGEV